MKNKRTIAIIAIITALVALLGMILTISITGLNTSGQASVENIVNPLNTGQTSDYEPGETIININSGSSDSDDDEDDTDNPEISLGSTIYIQENTNEVLNMDFYASDSEDSHSELTYTILSPTNDDIIAVTYNSATREVTLDAEGNPGETETLTIEVEDTDGNTDTDSVTVEIIAGSSPNSPIISGLPDITMDEDTSITAFDLDNYVSDPDNTIDELTYTVSGNTNINVNINSENEVTFTPNANWYGSEYIAFTVIDPDLNTASQTINVQVNSVDDPTVWNSLSNQEIDEDSPNETIVYSNILSEVSDPDGITVTLISVYSPEFNLAISMNGNDLVLDSLEANAYGTADITIEVNNEPAQFQLNVNQLYDDCVEICAFYKCEEVCD